MESINLIAVVESNASPARCKFGMDAISLFKSLRTKLESSTSNTFFKQTPIDKSKVVMNNLVSVAIGTKVL